jgi:selenocysteine-specific elongation factor
VIIGTAGHIDHGKTALVRALTGVDTDRLPEEKRRGITIDLGFAPIELSGGLRGGVVDVPGHEAFVRTMLAGATGIDVALLVIAADEGVMPQTREHVDILKLLDVRHGVVALTKADLVEEDWLTLVTEDVRTLLADSPLAGSPIVPTSVVTGAGLAELKTCLATALQSLPARQADDVFRMPIDRAFSVRGAGTVVTGTIWSGHVEPETTLTLLPLGKPARVRGVQVHSATVHRAGAGSRAALSLPGIDPSHASRGAVLVGDPRWVPTSRMRVDVALLDRMKRPLRPRERVRLHLGTSDVAARIVAVGGAVAPGELRAARAILDEPIVARAGDRFVLRAASPPVTIGGGVVRDPSPPHRRVRPWVAALVQPADRLRAMLTEGGVAGVDIATLPVRLGIPQSSLGDVLRLVESERVADHVIARASLADAKTRLVAAVAEHLVQHPLEDGVKQSALRAALGVPELIFDDVLKRAVASQELELHEGLVRRPGWTPQLDARALATREAVVTQLTASGREPPSTQELIAQHGQSVVSLLRVLERERLIVAVEPLGARYYESECLNHMVRDVQRVMAGEGEFSPAVLRDALRMSRKFLIPFLEYCDRTGVTERQGGGRVLALRRGEGDSQGDKSGIGRDAGSPGIA